MEVKYTLPYGLAIIYHEPESIFDAFLSGHLVGTQIQMSEQGLIFIPGINHSGDGLFGYEQNVDRCLWVYITKGQTQFIFIDDVRRNLFVDNLAEDRVRHGLAPDFVLMKKKRLGL